ADAELLANAGFNLQLARERLKRAKAAKENPSDEPKPGRKPGEESTPDSQPPVIGAEAGLETDAGAGQRAAEGSEKENPTGSQNSKRQGGAGNFPPAPTTARRGCLP